MEIAPLLDLPIMDHIIVMGVAHTVGQWLMGFVIWSELALHYILSKKLAVKIFISVIYEGPKDRPSHQQIGRFDQPYQPFLAWCKLVVECRCSI